MRPPLALAWALILSGGMGVARSDPTPTKSNYFNDPFVQLTDGLPACPTPDGPLLTADEGRAQAHGRVERGTSCYQDGWCRLPNSYLYDKEIMPRVKKAVDARGDLGNDTRVWALGQRRWVWLKGCVSHPEQAAALVQLVRELDDVEGVIDDMVVTPSPSGR